jgi:hypothetical protein
MRTIPPPSSWRATLSRTPGSGETHTKRGKPPLPSSSTMVFIFSHLHRTESVADRAEA